MSQLDQQTNVSLRTLTGYAVIGVCPWLHPACDSTLEVCMYPRRLVWCGRSRGGGTRFLAECLLRAKASSRRSCSG